MLKTNNYHILFLSVLFWSVALAVFLNLGVKNVNDSHRYLEYATNLKSGFYIDSHNILYIGYVLFIYFVRSITSSDNTLNLIIAQYLLAYVALILLYKSSLLLSQNTLSALISGLLYLTFIEITLWNSYLLCESYFLSLTCISFYFLVKIHRSDKSLPIRVLASIVILLTIATKPTGIALLISLIGIFVTKYWNYLSSYRQIIVSILALASTLIIANKTLETFLVLENYEIGEVVYGISTLPFRVEYEPLFIEVPEDLNVLGVDYPPLIRILHFVAFNFKYWTILFSAKVFYFLSHIRPFWSVEHNLFNVLLLLPIYYYSAKSLMLNSVPKDIKTFASIYFTIHVLSIGITTVDWDGRFLIPVLPLLFLLSASHIADSFKKGISLIFLIKKIRS